MDWTLLMPIVSFAGAFGFWIVKDNRGRIAQVVKAHVPRRKSQAIQESFAFKDLYDWKQQRRHKDLVEWSEERKRLLRDLKERGLDATIVEGGVTWELVQLSGGSSALREVSKRPVAKVPREPARGFSDVNRYCQSKMYALAYQGKGKRTGKATASAVQELVARYSDEWNRATWTYYRSLFPHLAVGGGQYIMNADGDVVVHLP